jgi:predicted oxidoreductase
LPYSQDKPEQRLLTLCETMAIALRGWSGSLGLDRAHDQWACSAGTLACAHLIEEDDMARSGSQERAKGASKQA